MLLNSRGSTRETRVICFFENMYVEPVINKKRREIEIWISNVAKYLDLI